MEKKKYMHNKLANPYLNPTFNLHKQVKWFVDLYHVITWKIDKGWPKKRNLLSRLEIEIKHTMLEINAI